MNLATTNELLQAPHLLLLQPAGCRRRSPLLPGGLAGAGEIRVNKAGCLDRCELGPVAVVYPDETWYTYIDESDLDEIIESHLKNGQPVERLKI